MAERSRGLLFRKRNILGAALAAGIGLGLYLGQWGGFGFLGSGKGTGKGSGDGASDTKVSTADSSINSSLQSAKNRPMETMEQEPDADKISDVIRVVIDEKQFLRLDGKTTKTTKAISLEKLIDLVKQAPGDQDGVRIKIYERDSARPSAEEALKAALEKAEIPFEAISWVPGQFK